MRTADFYPRIYDTVFESLKRNESVLDFEMYDHTESVGIEDGQFYITIDHHIDLFNDTEFLRLCNGAEIESSDSIGVGFVNTQLVF
jgi:hypothetical protein|tara:strand:- start:402 stop:659 length:258 start_codon:yes stop_codon:yes gene_type:complete